MATATPTPIAPSANGAVKKVSGLDPALLEGLPVDQQRTMVKNALANLQVSLFDRHINLVANRGVGSADKPQLAQNGQQFPSQNEQDRERLDGLSRAIVNIRAKFADLLAMPDEEPEESDG